MDKELNDTIKLSEEELGILRETFYVQAVEMTELLTEEVLALESNGNEKDSIKRIKRFFHTLKGDSATIGLRAVAEISHKAEDLLGGLEDRTIELNEDVMDLILNVVDEMTAAIEAHRQGTEYAVSASLKDRIERLTCPAGKTSPAETQGRVPAQRAGDEKTLYSVRLTFSPDCRMRSAGALLLAGHLPKWGDVIDMEPPLESDDVEKADFLKGIIASSRGPEELKRLYLIPGIIGEVNVEELSREATGGRPDGLKKKAARGAAKDTAQAIRVNSEKIDQLMDLVGELVMGRSMMGQLVSRFESRYPKDALISNFLNTNAFIGRSLSDLQRSVMSIRMVPIERVFKKFPRMVRDLSRAEGKEIDLVLEGEKTEVDKALVDSVGEPLLHLIRNAADHGIESPAHREEAGKDKRGTIRVEAYHQDNDIVIKVEDDGRGIDTGMLKEKAVRKGLITADDAGKMDEKNAIGLIFLPGFSTAETIDDVSGRGIGMDIVKEVVDGMRGTISVKSEVGKGTSFLLRFPMTLAVIKAIIFRIGDKSYALPMGSVMEILRVFPAQIESVAGRESLRNRDEVVPLVRLEDLVRSPMRAHRGGKIFVLVLNHAEQKIGLVVDRLVREEELVVKSVDGNWVNTDLVCGASILGDGKVVMILNAAVVATRGSRDALWLNYGKAAN